MEIVARFTNLIMRREEIGGTLRGCRFAYGASLRRWSIGGFDLSLLIAHLRR
jgi:hypothetical protein